MNTKFEKIGSSMQYDALSKEHANKLFRASCDACCNRGMHIDCDACEIVIAHELVIAIFEDMEKGNKMV